MPSLRNPAVTRKIANAFNFSTSDDFGRRKLQIAKIILSLPINRKKENSLLAKYELELSKFPHKPTFQLGSFSNQ